MARHEAFPEAVAMDMDAALDLEVKAQCPNAVIVYYRFHLVIEYGQEVMDRIRVDPAKHLRNEKAA